MSTPTIADMPPVPDRQAGRVSSRSRQSRAQRRVAPLVGGVVTALALAAVAAGCGGSGVRSSATVAPAATVSLATATTSPPDTAAPSSSEAPPTSPTTTATATAAACGGADLGGGLKVVVPCGSDLATGSVETGATAVPGSVLTLPDPSLPELETVDATSRQARTATGTLVTIYVFGSDTMFDTGSAQLRSTATPPLSAAIASIQQRWPAASVLVRGHTDSVGTAAANQALSQARASAVAAYLGAHGIAPSNIHTVGLGSTVPAALETNPDGSVNDLGRQLNRRVELVVIAP